MRLFLRDGYAATTVEQIADVAGISRRTFFRYFHSKEDVVFVRAEEVGLWIGEMFRARPLSEPPLQAMHHAMKPVVAEYLHDPARTRALLRLTQDTPELRARYKDIQDAWIRALSGDVERRHPEEGPMFAHLLAGLALSAMNVAVGAWLLDGGDLAAVLDRAFGLMPRLVAEPSP